MAKPASSIFTRVLQVAETTFNTLPTSPTMVDVPFVDCSLTLDVTKVVDNSIQGDALHRYVLPTTQKVAGTISGEVAHTNMDWLLTGIFYNTFNVANVLVSGITQPSYSIEVGSTDINQYFLYTGCVLDKLNLTFAPAGLVTYKADFIGASSNLNSNTNATTVSAAPQNVPMTVVNATIKEGGANTAYITGASFNFDRKTAVNYAVGNSTPVSLSTSFFDITGTLDVYLEDATLYGKFANNTNTSLDFTITDGTNTYEFVLPNVYYTSAAKSINGTGPIVLKMNFTAVRSNTTNTNATVTRSGP